MTEKTRGEKACDAFAAHLIANPMGGVIDGGGLSAAWSQYSELGQAAWEAAADVTRGDAIEECAQVGHEEQLQVWSDELAADLAAAGHLAEPDDYEGVLAVHRCIQEFISGTVLRRIMDLKSPEKPA